MPDEKKFPNGISHVADKIHYMGLKMGIYSSAGSMTCAHYTGSLGYEKNDADVWASWGVRLFPLICREKLSTNRTRSTTSNTTIASTKAKKEPPNSPSTATMP